MSSPVVVFRNPLNGTRWSASGNNIALLTSWGWVPVDDPIPDSYDPFPGYLTESEAAAAAQAGTGLFGVALRAAFVPMRTLTGFGAVGDGVTDDSAAIKAAEAALASGGSLYIPKGSYRFAQQSPAGGAAFLISGKSNVAVIFEPGAEILMDNLSGGVGTSHGIAVRGAASGITLVNPKVRWAAIPSTRSSPGDAFSFLGYPSDSAPAAGWTASTGKLSNIRVINPTAVNSPQTGLIFMGCSDVVVENSHVEATLADALHFNACRRVQVHGHTAVNCGDDGLAFVTYHHDTQLWLGAEGPFNQNGLTAWSNTGSAATGIVVKGGTANGCRIAGALDVHVSNLVVDGVVTAGLIIDSAIADGGSIVWSYKASRGIGVNNISALNTAIGVRVVTQNIDSADDESWWRFDARLDGVTVRNASNWSIRTEGDGSVNSIVAGLHIANVKVTTGTSGGGVGFSSLRDSYIGALVMESLSHASVGFYGQDAPLTGALSALPASGVMVDKIDVRGGPVLFQDFSRLVVGTVRSTNSPDTGVYFVRVANCEIGNVRVVNPNRNNSGLSRGILLERTSQVDITQVVIKTDANNGGTWRSVEIGGGDPYPAADGLRIEKLIYINAINQTISNVVAQGGPYGPINHYVKVQFFNGGETTPVWRSELIGTKPTAF